jgi:hypothetical protein
MELVQAFLAIVIPIVVVGLLVWLAEYCIPTMPQRLKTLIRVVAIVLVVIYLLDKFGLYRISLPG